ncbi:MAG: rhodanese-like domain-containing protein [Deltaproteobacteria bacterium]|nr:rhodanese-like domain-containing protein [Deltaproteobacteria bacterium]
MTTDRTNWLGLVAKALVLTVIGGALGLGVNAVRARGLPLVARSFDYQISCEEATVASANRTLTPPEAAKLRAAKDVALVDIRSAEAYAAGHAAGAQSLPVSSVMPTDPAKLAALTRYRVVIVYDEGEELGRAEEFAGELKTAGVKDVRFLGGGYRAYAAASQPGATGASP